MEPVAEKTPEQMAEEVLPGIRKWLDGAVTGRFYEFRILGEFDFAIRVAAVLNGRGFAAVASQDDRWCEEHQRCELLPPRVTIARR